MNVVELFAGAAGLAQGFERAGDYKAVALYDIFETAKRSYCHNYPEAPYYLRDVRKLKPSEVRESLDGRALHGVLGGPPCQGFSLVGKRLTEDEINQLVMAYGRVVTGLKPPFLVMENVPQLMFHPLFAPLLDELHRYYYVTWGILNAARYGTPQTRHRLFVIAYHKRYGIQPSFPRPTHGKRGQLIYAYHLEHSEDRIPLDDDTSQAIFGADQIISDEIARHADVASVAVGNDLELLVTVGDAISDLSGSIAENGKFAAYATPPQSAYQRSLRSDATKVNNCAARQHKGEPLRIVQTLREGGTPNVGASRGKNYYSQAYSRLHRDGLARTLTTYFQNAGSGRFFHYEQPRTLTIREAARLQGFADHFVLIGSLEEQMQLVGNAVPLPLAEAVGRHIAKQLGPCLSD